MSDFPFDNSISSDDKATNKSVFSSDGADIGKVEAALADALIVQGLSQDNSDGKSLRTKYTIPKIEIERIVADSITLRKPRKEIIDSYMTSSVRENWT